MALGLGIRQEKFERLWGLGQSQFTSDFPPYNLNFNPFDKSDGQSFPSLEIVKPFIRKFLGYPETT